VNFVAPSPLPAGRAIMSARSPDWRSGANPSGVGPDAFSDATRASSALARTYARSPRLLSCRTYPHRSTSRTHAHGALRSSSVNLTCVPTTMILRVLTASTPINTTPRHCLPTRAGAWGTEEGVHDRRREVSLVELARIFAESTLTLSHLTRENFRV